MKRPWKEIFDRTYEEERKKVNTLVGVNDFREGIRCKPNNKYVIVTILVAASVRRELPTINCYSDLDKALQILASVDHKSIEVKLMGKKYFKLCFLFFFFSFPFNSNHMFL